MKPFRRALVAVLACAPAGLAAASEAWVYVDHRDEPGNEHLVFIAQTADEAIPDESRRSEVTPEIHVRCEQAGLIVRIDWGRFISSFNTELGFRVDDGKRSWRKWKVDSSNRETFSPSHQDSTTLIDLLRNGERLNVEVTPYSEAPLEVNFSLAGFSEQVDRLIGNCG